MAQSYTNPGGTGDRRPTITVTTTIALGAGVISNLIDGTQSDNLWWNNLQSNGEVKFDFGAGNARLITEAKWYQSGVGNQNDWQWQGSNDNSSWTNIGATFTLGGVATQTITTLSGNATYYRYYRMKQEPLNMTNSGPFLREIEFLIDLPATNAQLTQEAVEQWAQPNASAQLTQLAAEEWGAVVSGARLALLTQISLEEWANVPSLARPMQTGVAINTG